MHGWIKSHRSYFLSTWCVGYLCITFNPLELNTLFPDTLMMPLLYLLWLFLLDSTWQPQGESMPGLFENSTEDVVVRRKVCGHRIVWEEVSELTGVEDRAGLWRSLQELGLTRSHLHFQNNLATVVRMDCRWARKDRSRKSWWYGAVFQEGDGYGAACGVAEEVVQSWFDLGFFLKYFYINFQPEKKRKIFLVKTHIPTVRGCN